MLEDQGDREVIRGLAVFDVHEDGHDLAVSLYGSDKCVCGSVTFTFANGADRRDRLHLIRSWERAGTPITYVSQGNHVTLVDEQDEQAREWLADQLLSE